MSKDEHLMPESITSQILGEVDGLSSSIRKHLRAACSLQRKYDVENDKDTLQSASDAWARAGVSLWV